jgi:enolase
MRAWNDFWGQEDRALSSRAAHRLEHRCGSAIGRAILQIGTVSETIAEIKLTQRRGRLPVISARAIVKSCV